MAPAIILAIWEAEIGRIKVEGSPPDPIFKRTRAKWTGSMDQVLEHLLGKREALSSNPGPTKKKRLLRNML
jgi:hypothetical protein